MKKKMTKLGFIVICLLVISLAVAWQIYRWNTFNEVTGSDAGFFKWWFIIDNRSK